MSFFFCNFAVEKIYINRKIKIFTIKNHFHEGSCKSGISLLMQLDEAEAPNFKLI